jgi:hypothetical protein
LSGVLRKNNTTSGFVKIAESLKKVIDNGEKTCTCKLCEKVGDAVIALDIPDGMQLEHTDNSFDYLCPVIQKIHRKHPSETKVITGQNIIEADKTGK